MYSYALFLLLGPIGVVLGAVFVPALFWGRRRLELRVRLLELLAAAVRRGLPLGEALAAAIDDEALPAAHRPWLSPAFTG